MRSSVDGRSSTTLAASLVVADREAIEISREMIKLSKMPMILVGRGVNRACASDELIRFARAWGIPVVNTWTAAGTIPYDDELSLHNTGLSNAAKVRAAFDRSDLVLAIGMDAIELDLPLWKRSGNKQNDLHGVSHSRELSWILSRGQDHRRSEEHAHIAMLRST